MESDLNTLKNSALQLNEDERAELAKSLLESLDDSSILYQDEWLNLVRERKQKYLAGESSSKSWDVIKKEAENRLKS
ncbi:MAG: addiction module protein [Balneolaceae bacterium]|nr:addiction module protein [Balneolaceae bacterium]